MSQIELILYSNLLYRGLGVCENYPFDDLINLYDNNAT